MKRKFLFLMLLIFSLFLSFAEEAVLKAMKNFDAALMRANSTTAKTTIGFITFENTGTVGTVVPWFFEELKAAAEETRRIEIVKTVDLNEIEQSVVATRGIKVIPSNAKNASEKKFVIEGTYYDRGETVEFLLRMNDTDGKLFSQETVAISKKLILEKNLTLYPKNKKIAEMVQEDFDDTEEEIKNEKKRTKRAGEKIGIAAAMLDMEGNLANTLYPNDVVKFKIMTDCDCYISIFCIDANGKKMWLPMSNNFMEEGKIRFFPDLRGRVLKVNDDGTFGAEEIIVYAATDEKCLPATNAGGKYSSQDLQMIMRRQKAIRENSNVSVGTFKITYTILER